MYEAVIGLECHVQLDTRTKLFCGCPNGESPAPNRHICPVCTGQPGALPVPNAAAIELAVRAALAIGCTVHEASVFARKQYFYPDLPKGYQISQYEEPLATGGRLHVDVGGQTRVFGITRLHVEEDAGRSVHHAGGTGVDLDRAGTPLAEIVSEPDLRTPDEAEAYLRTLHRVLVAAGVTQGDLEKGHLRCDANVSIRRPGDPLGTRVEIKNLNSFRFVNKALQAEIARQTALVDAGGTVVQETRQWRGGETEPMRGKEGSADYRYFPDPDLPVLRLPDALVARARAALPGVPLDTWLAARDRAEIDALIARYGLSEADAAVLRGNPALRTWFEGTVAAGGPPDAVLRFVLGPIAALHNEGRLDDARLTPSALAGLLALIDAGTLTFGLARQVLDVLVADGGDPAAIAAERGFSVVGDEAVLRDAARAAIVANAPQVAKYHAGNAGIVGFFMGAVMRATQGKADPALARRVVVEELEATPRTA